MLDKTVRAPRCSRAPRSRVSLVIAIPLGVVARAPAQGSFLAINASNVGRALPSLADHLDRPRPARHRLHQRDGGARGPGRAADADQRLRGRGPGRPRRRARRPGRMGMSPRQVLLAGRAAARAAADVRRHPHRGRLRDRHRDARRDRRRRRPGRHHRQPGELRDPQGVIAGAIAVAALAFAAEGIVRPASACSSRPRGAAQGGQPSRGCVEPVDRHGRDQTTQEEEQPCETRAMFTTAAAGGVAGASRSPRAAATTTTTRATAAGGARAAADSPARASRRSRSAPRTSPRSSSSASSTSRRSRPRATRST